MMEIKITLDAPELAKAINNLAESLSAIKTPVAPETKVVTKKEKTTETKSSTPTHDKPVEEKQPETDKEPDPILADDTTETVTYTPEQVRAKLRSLADNGKTTEMKQIISSFGASKLSDITANKYPEVMKLAEKAEKGEDLNG